MTHDEFVYRTLSEVCPGTKDEWPVGDAPPLPWFTFTHRRGGEVYADDDVYAELQPYQIELLYKENDPDLVSRFKVALRKIGTYRFYDDGYLDSEKCMHAVFLITLQPDKEREAQDGQH